MKKGVTLIELLIAISILAIVGAITMTVFPSLNKTQALHNDTQAVIGMIQQARGQTLSSKNASAYGVHLEANAVTLFTGSVYTAGAAGNQVHDLQTINAITSIALFGGGSDLIFNLLTGETSQDGTVTLYSAATEKSRIIRIYKTGLVESS